MDAWQIPSEQFYFYIFVNCSYFISFLFFVCELFIINFFYLFNLCGFFFAILCFFCYTLPCFLLVLGDWAYRVICFVVYCYLFIFFKNLFLFFIFFYLHGFSGFIFFCKFNCSWHFFTSSDRVLPGGLGRTGAPFRGLVSRGSKLYKWWFGKASGLIDIELMNMVPRKRLTMGWEDDTWARGGVRLLLPLAGHGWTIWEMVSIALFFFLSFENPWWLMAERLVLFVAGGSEGPQVGRRIPQCFLEHYSCYDTDRTAEITDAPTS